MIYSAYSLNGTWEMRYQEEAYAGAENPWKDNAQAYAGIVEKAVPGYWEDMTEAFLYTPFYRYLRVNPEYGIQ